MTELDALATLHDAVTKLSTAEASVVELAVALRFAGCTCWDHKCRRCEVLDRLFPGWRQNLPMLEDQPDRGYQLALKWRCTACDFEQTVKTPGFAGDGEYHYINGRIPCGPLFAIRADPALHRDM